MSGSNNNNSILIGPCTHHVIGVLGNGAPLRQTPYNGGHRIRRRRQTLLLLFLLQLNILFFCGIFVCVPHTPPFSKVYKGLWCPGTPKMAKQHFYTTFLFTPLYSHSPLFVAIKTPRVCVVFSCASCIFCHFIYVSLQQKIVPLMVTQMLVIGHKTPNVWWLLFFRVYLSEPRLC